MDFDNAPPMPVSDYRRYQNMLPGFEMIYAILAGLAEATLRDDATILIVGAGGGREIEALEPSPRRFRLTAVDPSADMLALALAYAGRAQADGRVTFIRGFVEDAPPEPVDAATSLLVMHFLPDDGAKAAYLAAIRARLRPGAPFMLADVTLESPEQFERLLPVFRAVSSRTELTSAEVDGMFGSIRAAYASGALAAVGEARAVELLRQAGFTDITPVFRALWIAGWIARAA